MSNKCKIDDLGFGSWVCSTHDNIEWIVANGVHPLPKRCPIGQLKHAQQRCLWWREQTMYWRALFMRAIWENVDPADSIEDDFIAQCQHEEKLYARLKERTNYFRKLLSLAPNDFLQIKKFRGDLTRMVELVNKGHSKNCARLQIFAQDEMYKCTCKINLDKNENKSKFNSTSERIAKIRESLLSDEMGVGKIDCNWLCDLAESADLKAKELERAEAIIRQHWAAYCGADAQLIAARNRERIAYNNQALACKEREQAIAERDKEIKLRKYWENQAQLKSTLDKKPTEAEVKALAGAIYYNYYWGGSMTDRDVQCIRTACNEMARTAYRHIGQEALQHMAERNTAQRKIDAVREALRCAFDAHDRACISANLDDTQKLEEVTITLREIKQNVERILDSDPSPADSLPSPHVVYKNLRTKLLAEVQASDVPRGLSPEDVAVDSADEQMKPTEAEVEALAIELAFADGWNSERKSYPERWQKFSEDAQDDWKHKARAAYAHIGQKVASLVEQRNEALTQYGELRKHAGDVSEELHDEHERAIKAEALCQFVIGERDINIERAEKAKRERDEARIELADYKTMLRAERDASTKLVSLLEESKAELIRFRATLDKPTKDGLAILSKLLHDVEHAPDPLRRFGGCTNIHLQQAKIAYTHIASLILNSKNTEENHVES